MIITYQKPVLVGIGFAGLLAFLSLPLHAQVSGQVIDHDTSAQSQTLGQSDDAKPASMSAQSVAEARQESQIWTTYMLSPHLRTYQLSVKVNNGKATLRGTVTEDVNKELAKQIALGVKGIEEVDNQILVSADYTPTPDAEERGFAQLVEDASITTTVKSKLLWSSRTDGMQTDVNTLNSEVTLSGRADTLKSKDFAGLLAADTRGVKSVTNDLVVMTDEPAPIQANNNATETVSKTVTDSWITAKVKSTFMLSDGVNGSAISVNTTQGMVKLSGQLASGAERDLAIELAQNIRGVKGVNSEALSLMASKTIASNSK